MNRPTDDIERAAIQAEDAPGGAADFEPLTLKGEAACSAQPVASVASAGPFSRGDHVELAERLLSRLSFNHDRPLVFDDGELYRYAPEVGLWQVVSRAEQSRIVQSFAGMAVKGRSRPLLVRASDVTGTIKLAHDQHAKEGFFAGAPSGLAFTNGFVRIDANGFERMPLCDAWRARTGYEFPFDPKAPASCERWTSFLHDLFRDDADREDRIAFLRQFTGACLLGIAPKYQRALVLLGDGDNGKSTLIEVIQAMFPPDSCVAIPPQQWGDDYKVAMLAGMRLNAVSELPEADILNGEAFKKIVTGDLTNARRIYGAPFEFRPVAGHIFAANRLPGTTDTTHGFWRRFVVVRLSRMFTAAEKRPNIAAEIIAAERPAIVAWMLEGGRSLLASNGYTIPASAGAELAEWRRNADSVALFCEHRTRPLGAEETGILAATLYDEYKRWAIDNGYRPVAARTFAERMRLLGKGSAHTRDGYRYPVALERHLAHA